jgi:hypothetical protein
VLLAADRVSVKALQQAFRCSASDPVYCNLRSSGKVPAAIRFAIQPNRPLFTSLWHLPYRHALFLLVIFFFLPLPTYPANPQMFRSRAVDPALRQLVVAGACPYL